MLECTEAYGIGKEDFTSARKPGDTTGARGQGALISLPRKKALDTQIWCTEMQNKGGTVCLWSPQCRTDCATKNRAPARLEYPRPISAC